MPPVRTKDYGRQYRRLWAELGPELERGFLGDDPVLGAALERFEGNHQEDQLLLGPHGERRRA